MLQATSRVDYFLFGLVFIKKKVINPVFLKPKPVQTDRFWFGYFRTKTGSNQFFQFGSVFLGLALFFYSLARFFSGLGSVWFFQFQVYKTKPVIFKKILINLIDFFSRFSFFGFFSGLIGFLIFLLTPTS